MSIATAPHVVKDRLSVVSAPASEMELATIATLLGALVREPAAPIWNPAVPPHRLSARIEMSAELDSGWLTDTSAPAWRCSRVLDDSRVRAPFTTTVLV